MNMSVLTTRPQPRNPESKVMTGGWKAMVMKRSWVTPHMLNIVGVLYSTVYTGHEQTVKTVPHEIFTSAGVAVTVDDMRELIDRKWVVRSGSEGELKYRLQTQGSIGYEILFYAEQRGFYPLVAPVPLTPDEILAKRRATKLDAQDPHRPRSLMDKDEAMHIESMRALTQLLENQAELDRQMQDLRNRQDTMVKVFTAMFDQLKEKE